MKTKFLLLFNIGIFVSNFSTINCMSKADISDMVDMVMKSRCKNLLTYVTNAIKNKQDLNAPMFLNSMIEKKATLYYSILDGYDDITEMLLAHGANPNIIFKDFGHEETPLCHAAILGKNNVVKILLKYGADPNQYITRNKRKVKVIDFLFSIPRCKANISKIFEDFKNKEKDSAKLFEAIQENNLLKLRFFIKKYFVNINVQNEKGEIPLHIAIKLQNFDAIIILLGHGANIEIQNKLGQTPIHYAADKPEVLKFLISFENLQETKKFIEEKRSQK
ncbi:ankyrin repeat domain-containing protein [Candidatus Dependentiae bacterium]|nr:ankyrin repeat domain-containing protein [Candidatus Dependentiae bacterium]